MNIERFGLEIVKTFNHFDDFAFGEGLNGTFGTNGKEEKPIGFQIGFDFGLDKK